MRRIVLLAASGMPSWAIGRGGCTPGTASEWRVRYARDRLGGLTGTGTRGAEPKYGPEHGWRILAMPDRSPPAGYANWTAPLLASELSDIHEALPAVPEDRLSSRKTWCESVDPEFVAKAADIVGLNMMPPRMRWCFRSMRSRRSRRWSAPRAT